MKKSIYYLLATSILLSVVLLPSKKEPTTSKGFNPNKPIGKYYKGYLFIPIPYKLKK